jgi:hypothetical protein
LSGVPPPSVRYTAFISYAREDESFAHQLETAIETHQSLAAGALLSVFRDRSDFTGSEYNRALEGHLQESASLIVVCSPNARTSHYVGDEIRRFAALHGTQRIFPVLVDGLPDNEADEKKSFPPALVEVLGGMPLAADYRGFDTVRRRFNDPRFESEWFKLLANLQDASPAEIRAQDKQHQVRALRKRMLAVAGIAIAMIVVAGAMAYLWIDARDQQRRAEKAEARERQMSERAQTELGAEVREKTGQRDTVAAPAPPTAVPSSPARGGAAAPVPQPAPPPTSTPSVATDIKPRVYFHIRDDNQRAAATQMQARLQTAGYIVPGIQKLDVGPAVSELRYFKAGDQADAQTIAAALAVPNLVVKRIPGYETSTQIRPHHFELWLAPATP